MIRRHQLANFFEENKGIRQHGQNPKFITTHCRGERIIFQFGPKIRSPSVKPKKNPHFGHLDYLAQVLYSVAMPSIAFPLTLLTAVIPGPITCCIPLYFY